MKKSALIVTVGLLAAMAAAAPATAKSPHTVDPATVTPTLNPNFAPWSCFEAGAGITCQGQNLQAYENELTDLTCDEGIYVTGSSRERMTRWHTADGRATKTVIHGDIPADHLTLSPSGDGPSVTLRGHNNRHYVYPVPGDRSSRVLTEVGALYLVNVAGQRLVLQDTGRVTFEPGLEGEEIASMQGIHEYYSDPTALDRVICDALT